jgi:hypothetical protein
MQTMRHTAMTSRSSQGRAAIAVATTRVLSIARNRGDARRQQRDWLAWADLRRTWRRHESDFSRRRHYALDRRKFPRGREAANGNVHKRTCYLAVVLKKDSKGTSGCQLKRFVGRELVRLRDGTTPGQAFKDWRNRALSV